jgi:hypothetical protein
MALCWVCSPLGSLQSGCCRMTGRSLRCVCWRRCCAGLVSRYSAAWLGGFQIGIELLLLNGVLTFGGLALLSRRGGGKERVVAEAGQG